MSRSAVRLKIGLSRRRRAALLRPRPSVHSSDSFLPAAFDVAAPRYLEEVESSSACPGPGSPLQVEAGEKKMMAQACEESWKFSHTTFLSLIINMNALGLGMRKRLRLGCVISPSIAAKTWDLANYSYAYRSRRDSL